MHSFRRFLLVAAVLTAAFPLALHAVQETGPSKAAQDAGTPYLRALVAAASFYAKGDYDGALQELDVADQVHTDIPDTWMMRGAIYAEQHAYEKAQDAFEKANKLNPGDFWAPYNVAQLLLMEKKYADATDAFEKLLVYRGHEELVEFKIIIADIIQDKLDDAKKVLDSMKFPPNTPAYYFANSAYSFAIKNDKDGKYWSNAGVKVFGAAPCAAFYDSLVGLGWLPKRNADGSIPAPSQLSILPAATPNGPLQ